MKKNTSGAKTSYSFGNLSDTGLVREHNEDYFGYFDTPSGGLFIVCDGMGGHNGGEVASRLTVETISAFFKKTIPADPGMMLDEAISRANREVWNESKTDDELAGMGTTLVLVFFPKGTPHNPWIAHVGDSRIYRIRDNAISRLTEDHSKVMMLVKLGLITPEQAMNHPEKNIITRALGIAESVTPDIRQIEVVSGDRLILCTDGITDLLTDQEIESLAESSEPQAAAEKLIRKANERGGLDNSTVQIIDINGEKRKNPPFRIPKIKAAFPKLRKSTLLTGALAAISIVVLIAFLCSGPDLSAEKTFSKASDQPAYEITVTTAPENTVTFQNEHVESLTDYTWRIAAEHLNTSPDSTAIHYTVSRGESERTDSVMILNEFEVLPITINLEPNEDDYEHVLLHIAAVEGAVVSCNAPVFSCTLNTDSATELLAVRELVELFPPSIDTIHADLTFTAEHPEYIKTILECTYNHQLPEIQVFGIRPEVEGDGYRINGTTWPDASITAGNISEEADSAGEFSVLVRELPGSLTLRHPLGRETEPPVTPIESRIQWDSENIWIDTETHFRWHIAEEEMNHQQALEYAEAHPGWRIPTAAQVEEFCTADGFTWTEGRVWTAESTDVNCQVYIVSSQEFIPSGIEADIYWSVFLVTEE